jgi:hypothetical protein
MRGYGLTQPTRPKSSRMIAVQLEAIVRQVRARSGVRTARHRLWAAAVQSPGRVLPGGSLRSDLEAFHFPEAEQHRHTLEQIATILLELVCPIPES